VPISGLAVVGEGREKGRREEVGGGDGTFRGVRMMQRGRKGGRSARREVD